MLTAVRWGCLCPLLTLQLAPRRPLRLPPAPWGPLSPMVAMPEMSRVVLPPLQPRPLAMRPAPGRLPGAWSGRVLRRFSPPLALVGKSASAHRGVRPAAAAAEVRVSTDDYMPDAEPDVDARPLSASRSASAGSQGSIGELRLKTASAAAILRIAIDARGPAADVEAARADAVAAQAALDAALAASVTYPEMPLPRDIKPIYKAPPPEAMAPPQAARAPPSAAVGAAASSAGPAAESDALAGDDVAAPIAPAGAATGPVAAEAIPVPEPVRAPAARRPSKGGNEGKGGEVEARRSFLGSAVSQADAVAAPDGRGFAAPGCSVDADDSAGSDI